MKGNRPNLPFLLAGARRTNRQQTEAGGLMVMRSLLCLHLSSSRSRALARAERALLTNHLPRLQRPWRGAAPNADGQHRGAPEAFALLRR